MIRKVVNITAPLPDQSKMDIDLTDFDFKNANKMFVLVSCEGGVYNGGDSGVNAQVTMEMLTTTLLRLNIPKMWLLNADVMFNVQIVEGE